MERLDRILVPVDFSPFSKRALRAALLLAGNSGAEVHLLHVIPEYEVSSVFHIALPSRNEIERKADDWAGKGFDDFIRGEDLSGVKVVPQVRYGNPARVICGYAAEVEADMIVIASHGRSGFQRAVFGSVAEKVLRLSDLPVLVIKGK